MFSEPRAQSGYLWCRVLVLRGFGVYTLDSRIEYNRGIDIGGFTSIMRDILVLKGHVRIAAPIIGGYRNYSVLQGPK